MSQKDPKHIERRYAGLCCQNHQQDMEYRCGDRGEELVEADEGGIHDRKLRKRAIAIGEKIGLYRDWPVSKGCTPPYVPVWVEFMVKRQG